uniref:AP-1 complex subunit mu-1-I-like n=1 Tax=Dermatophagoides pteronyssinus TaxID=6956 RepID=A0A6P6XY06_DERPT|nr:AP-1 complex subunit mu-1-I-like [Dermatophagoides pteronyssinus]
MNSAIAWRANSVKHRKNEIYVDVVESFSAALGPDGAALESGVSGVVRMKSFLSGLPELKLGLFFAQPAAQPRVGLSSQDAARSASRADLVECVKSDKLQELRFHPCVRLNRFRAEKEITFIPPDGEFDLLSYSIRREHLADVPFTVTCQHLHNTLDPEAVAFELVVRLRANFAERITARFVKVIVPTPSNISKPKTKPGGGSAHYAPSLNAVVWHLSLMTGGEQRELSIKAARSRLGREAFKTWTRSPLRLEFEIPFFTASNLRVEYLRIAESSGYPALPWVRYLTNSKDYEARAF